MRKIFLILFTSILALNISAQLSVGLRQGYGSHGVNFDPNELVKYQVPYYLPNTGLVIVYNNTNNVGLQAEINYAQKGWQEKDTIQGPYFKRNITYLEIPIYSHWEIGYGKVRPLIFAGPYIGIKLNESTDSANFSRLWYDESVYVQYDQEIRDLHYGIKLGLGLRYNITSRLGIFIDVRYDLEIAGSRDIFIDRPDGIDASRLEELSGSFGIIWHIMPQPKKIIIKGYTPKEDLIE